MNKLKTMMAVCAAAMLVFASCNNSGSTADKDKEKADSAAAAMKKDSMDKAMAVKKDSGGVMVGGAMMVPAKDIVENAMNSKDHTTLVAAVQKAGLVSALKGDGPFTVFAPDNKAFDAVDKKALNDLMKPEHKAELTKVLTYHVVKGAYKSADLKDGQELTTLEGGKLTVMIKDGNVMIHDETGHTANVVKNEADIIDKNGVTNVIDAVLMPKMDMKAGKMDKKDKM